MADAAHTRQESPKKKGVSARHKPFMADLSSCLTLSQAAGFLGVSTRTVRTWINDPTLALPAYRVGGRLLLKKSELDQFLNRHRVRPVDACAQAEEILASLRSPG